MSPVMQAMGWRIVHIWVWLHLMLTFAYSGVPLPTRCSTKFTTAGLWASMMSNASGTATLLRVVVVFEAVKFRASKTALGVGESTDARGSSPSYSVTPGRRASMAPSAAIGTAVSEQIFASSIFHCNIMYQCCPRSTEKTGFSWRRLQEDVSVFSATPLCILRVWFRRWRCWADDVPAVFILVSVMAMTVPKSAPTMAPTMITTAARCVHVAIALSTQRGVRRSSLNPSLPKRFLVSRARPGDDFFAG